MAPGSSHLQRRRVRIRLRGSRIVEGDLHIAEGRSLVDFLSVKKHFVNLTTVGWTGDPMAGPEKVPHLAVRMSQILWVEPMDPDLDLTSSLETFGAGRPVQLYLEGDIVLRVELHLAEEHRMSDYLDANDAFIPFRNARMPQIADEREAVAVNHSAILAVREL